MAYRTDNCTSCNKYRTVVGRGLCRRCYSRARYAGELDRYPLQVLPFHETLAAAQAAQTDEGCWQWPHVGLTGYPTTVMLDGVVTQAHVVSWVKVNGPVPKGLTLDHLCHTNSATCPGGLICEHRRCVRPDHLEPVTQLEQTRRTRSYTSPTCPRGHERNEANVAWYLTSNGYWSRRCRLCDKERYVANRIAAGLPILPPGGKTHCPHGHEYTPENTYRSPNGGGRQCRECMRLRNQALPRSGLKPGECGAAAAQRAKTHCPQGHPYSGDNLYVVPENGARRCRTCIREQRSLRTGPPPCT